MSKSARDLFDLVRHVNRKSTPSKLFGRNLNLKLDFRFSFLWFPAAILLIASALITINISGSSLAIYGVEDVASPQENMPVFGKVRPIRSDEWLVRTPWLLNQVENGFETVRLSGMGIHKVGLVGDIPTRDLDLLVKPHHIPLLFIDKDRALASEWWIWHVLMAWGAYFLLFTLTRQKVIPAVISLLLVSSPSTQWWLAPGTFTTVGYGCLAAAAFIASMNKCGNAKRFPLAALAGWLFACFVCTLYIPWVITTAIVVGFVILGAVIEMIKSYDSFLKGMRELLIPILTTLSCSISLIIIFYFRHQEALDTITNTVYPGARVSESGGGIPIQTLLGAPFDYLASRQQTSLVNGTNQSENSSGIFYSLPVFVSALWLWLQHREFRGRRNNYVLGCILVVGVLFLSWLLLPVNSKFGQILLLDRVPPIRILPAMTLVSLLALAVFLAGTVNSSLVISRRIVLSATGIFAAAHIYAFSQYTINGHALSIQDGLPVITYLSFVLYMLFRKHLRTGMFFIMVFGVLQYTQVNPLQHGTKPLLQNPVASLISEVKNKNSMLTDWFLFGGDSYVRGTLEASSINFVTGVSRYPDRKFWEILDPNGHAESAWNRYGHLYIAAGAIGSEPLIVSNSPDTIEVTIDPCDNRLRLLGVDVVITQDFEIGCHHLIESTYWGNRLIRVYLN